jgi:eukaryotic-like serine/threonine-protein kinase
LKPDLGQAYTGRGNVFLQQGRVDDAIVAYDQAVRVDPTKDGAHSNLGNAWQKKGDLQRALAAHFRAVELNPRSGQNHYNLGNTLGAAGDWARAIGAYEEAVQLDPNNAEAFCNLAQALQEQGRYVEGLAALERGHQLGTRRPNWGYPSAKWLDRARYMVELAARLPRILDGSSTPETPEQQLAYGSICQRKGLYGAGACLYAGAFTAKPALATSLEAGHRFRAAWIAVLAGSAAGRDEPKLQPAECARWRKQALDWLRSDLALWAHRLDRAPNSRPLVRSALERWRREKALAGIREPEEVARLPGSERADYIQFWADVQTLLVRCLASSAAN